MLPVAFIDDCSLSSPCGIFFLLAELSSRTCIPDAQPCVNHLIASNYVVCLLAFFARRYRSRQACYYTFTSLLYIEHLLHQNISLHHFVNSISQLDFPFFFFISVSSCSRNWCFCYVFQLLFLCCEMFLVMSFHMSLHCL